MIIFVEQDPSAALPSRRILYKMCILSAAIRPDETEQIARFPAKAVIVSRPADIDDIRGLVTTLRQQYPHLPLAVFPDNYDPRYRQYEDVFDFLYSPTATSTRVVKQLFTEYEERTGKNAFFCIVEGVRTDILQPRLLYLFGAPYRVSQRHYMMLRYLSLCAPRYIPAEELLTYCFPLAEKPGLANVPAQICYLNRQTMSLCPGYAIITFKHGQGYYITPHFVRRHRATLPDE